MNLLTNQLATLPSSIIRPTYDRRQLKTKMVHLGFGAFHRAHQAVYTDRLTTQNENDWGYCEVNLIGGEQQIEALKQQDLLYSVAEMAPEGWSCRVIGVVCSALHAQTDGLQTVLEALAAPDITIVSITITEKGYCHNPATGQLNQEHPLIQYDIAQPAQPKSAVGVIVQALRLRRERGLTGFTVMSCDNMPENGHVTHNVVVQLARLQDAALADWIEQNVTFPSTMVDRIVPAVTEETAQKIERLLGVNDQCGVACEPFRQWVIEDNFKYGRPAWENVGAELVQDVLPYEEMKLRMLNGSHSFLAYLGYLAGYQYINECMTDDNYVITARHLMLTEQAATLRVKDVDLTAYADSLIHRYRNTALKHRTWQIAMDGSQKLPQRMLDSVRFHLAHNRSFDCLALGIAGWMRYVGGIDEQGQPIEINDPLAEQFKQIAAFSTEGEARVKALLSIDSIFGQDLPTNLRFVETVTQAYLALLRDGAKVTVMKLANRLSHHI